MKLERDDNKNIKVQITALSKYWDGEISIGAWKANSNESDGRFQTGFCILMLSFVCLFFTDEYEEAIKVMSTTEIFIVEQLSKIYDMLWLT